MALRSAFSWQTLEHSYACWQVLDSLRAEGKAVNPSTGFWLERGPTNGRVDRGGTGEHAWSAGAYKEKHLPAHARDVL